jgi:spore coat polysaccharide biosynthesis protein SpsF
MGGMPLVVLSALRAANNGSSVVVATSSEVEDEILADTVRAHGLECIRGSLNDVHSRFLMATKDMAEDAWVVRLTADNCFPDGDFINSLVDQATERGLEYLGTSSPADGLPYGLSAEVFTVRALRSVAGEGLSEGDREHVTPAIRRRYGAAQAQFEVTPRAQLHCTVDTKNDYFRLLELFSQIDEPLKISWQALCDRLAMQEGAARFRIPWKQHQSGIVGAITLGTAQIGIQQYGRVNTKGQPSHEEAYQLLDTAVRHGVTHIDTASAYGDAEQRIGAHLSSGLYAEPTIITKLDPLVDLAEDASADVVANAVEASVYQSLHALQVRQLPVLMLHRWSHYRSHGGWIWKTLCRLKAEGLICQLGASVSRPTEAIEALEEANIIHLQIPFNLLDHRWRTESFRDARGKRPDVVIYGRSAYLQGILIADAEAWPAGEGYDAAQVVDQLDSLVQDFGRQSRADLCIAYVQASSLVDSIVMGVETVSQLRENLSLVGLPPLTENEVELVEHTFNDAPEWLLDPSQW